MFRKLATLSLAMLSFSALAKKKKKVPPAPAQTAVAGIDYKSIGAPLPPLRIITEAGKVITEQQVDSMGNLFLMLFNPTCSHCQEVTHDLEKNVNKFREGQVLMVATAGMMPYMEFFRNVTKVDKYPRFWVGVDSSDIITKAYTYKSLPQINIYNKERKLIKTFSGETPIDSLEPYIR